MLDAGNYQYILLSYSDKWDTILSHPELLLLAPGGRFWNLSSFA